MDILMRIINYNNFTKKGENYQHFRTWSKKQSRNCETGDLQLIGENMP